jgi:hemolysin activation/secretion protein
MLTTPTKMLFAFLFVGLFICVARSAQDSSNMPSSEPQVNDTRTMEDEATREMLVEKESKAPEPNLPEDTSARISVKKLSITGNTLIPTENIFKRMPEIYNSSDKPLLEAPSRYLYDFRPLHAIISEPNQPQEVSLRTIEGLLQYILSVYQSEHYAGIYVYIPKGTLKEGMKLEDGVLLIQVTEASVGEVEMKFFGADQNEVEAGYLRRSALEEWSPVKAGEVANQKALDYFVNLLNLNPDRYVSVTVSKGTEPNTLDVQYDIYETDPWHYFVQIDNSGTKDRQWSPRVGIINTNLLGIDDRFTVVYQAKPDSTIDDDYSVFGSYDLPVLGPRVRLNLYGGHSEFDINPEGGLLNFLGRGTFYGALLRYNALQHKGWFFDITGSLGYERSKVTPSLFPSAGSDVDMELFGVGAELHRSDDISNTSVSFNRTESIGGSSRRRYQLARTNADPDFAIYMLSANHSQYLDKDRYGQLRAAARLITSNERLVPAKMTSFGGMYSVRGYDEYEIVADGGVLASVQYEFDWLRYNSSTEVEEVAVDPNQEQSAVGDLILRKLSPLVFMDYGRTDIKDPVAGEKDNQTLWSVGVGSLFEFGENLSGACYYGYPLRKTDDTRRGKGRLNVSFMLRW